MSYTKPPLDTLDIIETLKERGLRIIDEVYWLNAIAPDNTLAKDFRELLDAYSNIDTRAMGFSENWRNEPLWQ